MGGGGWILNGMAPATAANVLRIVFMPTHRVLNKACFMHGETIIILSLVHYGRTQA